jgi:4-amino-4-deoxy-L-arabinose transferase-like glycosyltransferase
MTGSPARAEVVAPTVFFPCTGCGKNLKTPAALVGKRVQCPQCGGVLPVPQTGIEAAPAPLAFPVPPAWLVLVLVLLASFLLELRNLDHTALTHWDEVFHAIVAQNVSKHPLKPTLVDVPYLPYNRALWKENHVWLHKPILPLWQVALSFLVLGVNTFALRLPSALLSTGAAGLTYLIGTELFDRRAALLAAVLQAANPFVLTLVHGYQFADLIDVALIFWVEVGVYFLVRALRTGSWRDVLLAGVAQGLAYLSKSYLAGIIFGMALTAWLLPVCRLGRREECRLNFAHLLGLLGASVLTVAPWFVYCLTHYPEEFGHEHAQIWKHLSSNVENWAAPWDRLVFDYLITHYGVFYTPVLVAAVVLVGKAVARRHVGLWLMYAWGFGVVLPHLFAVTKTPSAAILALPAFLLLLGCLVSEASRGDPWSLASLAGVLAMSVLVPAVVKSPGYGFPSPRVFGEVMRHAQWVIGHLAGTLAVVAVVAVARAVARRHLAAGGRFLGRYLRAAGLTFCLLVLAWLEYQNVEAAWRVTGRNQNDPFCAEVGRFARERLPGNAVLLCEERAGYEHLTTMFYADRICYPLAWGGPDELARKVIQAGGVPFVVSYRKLPLDAVYATRNYGPTVYAWAVRPPE